MDEFKFRNENIYYSNSEAKEVIKFTSRTYDTDIATSISEFSSILELYQQSCKKGEIFIYMDGNDSFILNGFIHVLTLKHFMSKHPKSIYGINFGNKMSGILLKCQNFQPLISYLRDVCLSKVISVENCLSDFNYKGQKIYSFRYELIMKDKIAGIEPEFKNNYGFNPFTCDLQMLSPCEKKLQLDKYFEFRDEQIISANLGVTVSFRNEIAKAYGIKIYIGSGRMSCTFMCNSNKMSCHPLMYLFINDCKFMKNEKKCERCLSHDEGTDQPFYHGDECRLRSRFGFDCGLNQMGTTKICACF
eukprot:gene6350-10356_t